MGLVAYLDESRKPVRDPATGRVAGGGEHYVVAAAVVFGMEADGVRTSVRAIERDLSFALHYGELRSRARRIAIDDRPEIVDVWQHAGIATSQVSSDGDIGPIKWPKGLPPGRQLKEVLEGFACV